METCEIYILDLRYDDQKWIDNPDDLLQLISNNLSEIDEFSFTELTINMSQVYNVSLKESHYDAMILYIKNIKYKHNEFLSIDDVQTLEQELTKHLSYIEKLTFGPIEFRTSVVYTDLSLGLPIR
jgi:hypothetical protein